MRSTMQYFLPCSSVGVVFVLIWLSNQFLVSDIAAALSICIQGHFIDVKRANNLQNTYQVSVAHTRRDSPVITAATILFCILLNMSKTTVKVQMSF